MNTTEIHSARHLKIEPNTAPGWVYLEYHSGDTSGVRVYPVYFWHYLEVTFVSVDENQVESTYTRPVTIPSHSVNELPTLKHWDDLSVLHHKKLFNEAQNAWLYLEHHPMDSRAFGDFRDSGMELT